MPGSISQVAHMEGFHTSQMRDQSRPYGLWQHGDPVFVALAAANHDLARAEVHVLHSKPEGLQQPEPAPIEQPADQRGHAIEFRLGLFSPWAVVMPA